MTLHNNAYNQHNKEVNMIRDITKNKQPSIFLDKHGFVWFYRGKQWEVVMDNSDIVTYLKEKKAFYLEELKKINAALSAIEKSPPQGKGVVTEKPITRRKVKWTQKITGIFQSRSGERLTPANVREALLSQGIVEVDAPGNKNVIYTTLTRLVKNGVIDKIEAGIYCLKIKEVRQPPYAD